MRTKQAAPRWVKRFLTLSPESQKYLLSTLKKERELKNLGQGGERIADLVVHPKHGLSVRKTPVVSTPGQRSIDAVRTNRANQRQMEARLTELGKGTDAKFSRLLSDPKKDVSYYDHIPGKSEGADMEAEWGALLVKKKKMREDPTYVALKRKNWTAYRDHRDGKISEAEFDRLTESYEAAEAKITAVGKQMYALDDKIMRSVKMDRSTERVLRRLKKEYKGLHDIRPSNIVNGHLVDASPAQKTTAVGGVEPKEGVKGYSKKTFMGPGSPRKARLSRADSIQASKRQSEALGKRRRAARLSRVESLRRSRPKKPPQSPPTIKPNTPRPPKTNTQANTADKGWSTGKKMLLGGGLGIAAASTALIHKYVSKKRGKDNKWQYKYRA